MPEKRTAYIQQSSIKPKIRKRSQRETKCRSVKTGTEKKALIWKRGRKSHKGKQDPVVRALKQADLDMLALAAATGEIDLKYLDESGLVNYVGLPTR